MKKGLAEGLAEGLEKGIEKGMVAGMQKGQALGEAIGEAMGIKKIATNMLQNHEPIEKIMQFTGLSHEAIKQLEQP
jgi:predicted transposase YdaD